MAFKLDMAIAAQQSFGEAFHTLSFPLIRRPSPMTHKRIRKSASKPSIPRRSITKARIHLTHDLQMPVILVKMVVIPPNLNIKGRKLATRLLFRKGVEMLPIGVPSVGKEHHQAILAFDIFSGRWEI